MGRRADRRVWGGAARREREAVRAKTRDRAPNPGTVDVNVARPTSTLLEPGPWLWNIGQ